MVEKIRNRIAVILLLQIFIIHCAANELNSGIKQFDKLVYNAASQNWGVSSNGKGFIYFANNDGLLEFDGTSWRLYSLPNQTVVRAVNANADTIIFTSGYRELGYWTPNEFGDLQYHSLNEKAKRYFSDNIEFWNIAVTDSIVYFHSFNRILAYDLRAGSFAPVVLPGFVSVMSRVGGKILVSVRNYGIYEIIGVKAVPFITGDFFENKLVRFLFPCNDRQMMIGTASNGIFVWDGKQIMEWNQEWTSYFIKNELNRGHRNSNGQFIFGTIIDGVVIFDEKGNLKQKVNSENGLPNNTVLGIECDPWDNTWLAMDYGIGFISGNKKRSFLIEETPGVGAVYSTAILDSILYLGSNQGLFARPMNSGDKTFSLIPGTQDQIWDCQIIDGNLLAGHNQGTFIVKGMNAKRISTYSGGFAITPDPRNNDIFIQSTYSNLITYKKTNEDFVVNNSIQGFADLIRYIEFDHLGNLWASHMHRGIYKIITDDKRQKVLDSEYFGENVFGQDQSIHVFKLENRIVFTTGKRIFTYDDLRDTIVPFTELNHQLRTFAASHRIVEAPNHHYWFISKDGLGLFKINQNTRLIKKFPTSLFKNTLVDGFENILPLTEYNAILTMYNGIAYLDASISDTMNIFRKFSPVLRELEIATNRGRSEKIPTNRRFLKIRNNFNNVRFNFSFPHLTEFPVNFHYDLTGQNNSWSDNTLNNEFFFERLPADKYDLSVRVTDPWGNESQVFEFNFEVLPPVYMSKIAVAGYVVVLLLTLLLFRNMGIRQTRKKEQLQHEKRAQELIRLRNEKLRNEIEHKSKELANSTMALIKKNEFLMDLKKTVSRQKNELGSRYPDKYYNYLNDKIDRNISSQDDWKLFETNFEQAHEQFLKKIKERYPDLTPGDLRLCAYLRMNLSSKEIAPLLGISVRGVENHRYRLRKKLKLKHDKVLTDTILSL